MAGMLIEFSVENFLSFNERVTLSLVAAPELDEPDGLIENTVEAPGGIRLLKSTLVFGANASGKSNLVKAVLFARNFVLGSSKESQAGEAIAVEPFLLGTSSSERGSAFEFVWIADGARYRYSFSVNTSRVLVEELARARPGDVSEVELFRRDHSHIQVADAFPEGRDIVSKTRDNALFLSVCAQLNGEESQKILAWFTNQLSLASGVQDERLLGFTVAHLRLGTWKQEILQLAREADLGITGISVNDVTAEMLRSMKIPASERERLLSGGLAAVTIQHRRFDAAGQPQGEVELSFESESEGTKKFIALTGPLLRMLKNGVAFFLDELDARLHPRLTRAIVDLFHGDANAHGAQLIGATHETNLLDRRLVRRDQIWFTEKDARGATKLFSLAEFDLHPQKWSEREYLLGKYGGVPAIGTLITPEVEQ